RLEALGIGAAQPEARDDVPRAGNLRLRHRPDVAVMLVAPGDLQFGTVDERYLHVRRHQRDRQFGIGGGNGAAAAGVRRRAGPDQVAGVDEAADRVNELDRAVDMRVAIVDLRLAPNLAAEGEADIAARQG